MAARRVSKSAVDWAAFAERVPANQKDCYRALKFKNDEFTAKVNQFPAEMAAIDFNMYRSKLASPALVETMEKEGMSLPAPFFLGRICTSFF
ncbi:hypothetical protein CAPTEDRAFT_98593 [Capitella teleta]|uniref:Uncharacterized protein n=1 Tax=Capitella teleta TaxID=283909 RepID=R7T459_CAPTE|nr:hypothetical protein CAPTEDRAFT_98593 [Capitella teleta]|eukprot:ELT87682.1 hypothetical protein CAPTEDRAFT_98593 [Capitella teleta]